MTEQVTELEDALVDAAGQADEIETVRALAELVSLHNGVDRLLDILPKLDAQSRAFVMQHVVVCPAGDECFLEVRGVS